MYIPKDVCRVAVIHPTQQPFEIEILQALHASSSPGTAYENFQFTFVPTELKKASIQKRALSVIEKGFHVYLTIGRLASIHAKEIFANYGGYPHISLGAAEPIKLGLSATLDEPGEGRTVITRQSPAHETIARCLQFLIPHRKGIMIPYLPEGEAGKVKEQVDVISNILNSAGMAVYTMPIETGKEILSAIKHDKYPIDTVLFLEGCWSGDVIREAADLCWERNILLCGNGLDAIRFGASCTFGGELYPYVDATFSVLKRFWYEKMPMGLIPVTMLPDNQKFVINVQVLRAIGMTAEAIEQFTNQPDVEVVRVRV